jgi:hypothetical protein
MGTPLMGRYAAVKIDTVLVENLGRWTLDIRMDEIDVSVFGTVWGKMIPGMQKWTATLEGFYDPADTTGQAVLEAAALAATKLTNIRFYIDSTSYWAPDQVGDSANGAYISGISVNHDKAGVAALTMNMIGFGKILLN